MYQFCSIIGHPLCEFCEERFFDDEELFKHLRKDHYFCHFCDADGFQYFYAEYSDLRRHFDKDHFLCTEPECEEQKFVVFRTEIDFKGHRLERHSGAMSKAASKEARKVELEFNFNNRCVLNFELFFFTFYKHYYVGKMIEVVVVEDVIEEVGGEVMIVETGTGTETERRPQSIMINLTDLSGPV